MSRNVRSAPLALLLALLAPPVLSAEVVPASHQFEIAPPKVSVPKSLTFYQHVAATVLSLGSRGFVVGWETAHESSCLHDCRNDVTGGLHLLFGGAPAETFNPTTFVDYDGWVGELSFADLGSGRFASIASASAFNADELFLRRFAAGQGALDPESVLLFGESDVRSDSEPWTAGNGTGRFVIAWSRRHQDDQGRNRTWQEMAQVYGADGLALTPEIAVTEPVPESQWGRFPSTWPAVGMDAAGNFVVLWTARGDVLAPVWGRRFDAAGVPQGEPFRLGSQPGASPGRLAMAMAPSGEFVAAWRAPAQAGTTLLSRFTADGQRAGRLVRLAVGTGEPVLALSPSGRVALFWIDGRRPALAVFGPTLDPLGPVVFDPPGSRGALWAEPPIRCGVAFGSDGRLLTVWVGPRGRGTGDSILGRFWRIR